MRVWLKEYHPHLYCYCKDEDPLDEDPLPPAYLHTDKHSTQINVPQRPTRARGSSRRRPGPAGAWS